MVWQKIQLLIRQAKAFAGASQGPEIFAPGETPTPRRKIGKWRVVLSLLVVMVVLSTPAALLLWASAGLIDVGLEQGGLLPWLALVLLAPVTLAFSFVALAVDAVLFVIILTTLTARKRVVYTFRTSAPDFGDRPVMRDVSPKAPSNPSGFIDSQL